MDGRESNVTPPMADEDQSCFICTGGHEECNPLSRAGCACRGSLGVVHLSCAVTSAKFRDLTTSDRQHWYWCQTCKRRYTGDFDHAMACAHYEGLEGIPDSNDEKLRAFRGVAVSCRGDKARRLITEVLRLYTAAYGDKDRRTLMCKAPWVLRNLLEVGKVWEAVHEFTGILVDLTSLGVSDDSDVAVVLSYLAAALQGCPAAAAYAQVEKVLQQLLGLRRRLHGDDACLTWEVRQSLATLYSKMGRLGEAGCLEKAVTLERELLARQVQVLGKGHPDTVRAARNLATTIRRMGQRPEAIKILECALRDCASESLRDNIKEHLAAAQREHAAISAQQMPPLP